MGHTPGPWYLVDDNPQDGPAIATVPIPDGIGAGDPREVLGVSEWLRAEEDDLRLMAAAPELLALVEKVEWIVSSGGWFGASIRICPWCQGEQPYGHDPDCPFRAALAKVRGTSSP
jgi:hypothetical protein